MITKQTSKNTASYTALFERASKAYNEEKGGNVKITTLEQFFRLYPDLVKIDPSFQIMPLIGDDLGREASFDINANTRAVVIPDSFKKNGLGVKGDHLAETVFFTIDRFYDDVDLYSEPNAPESEKIRVVVQWENAAGQTGVSEATIVDAKILANDNKLLIGWAIDENITKDSGSIKFAVRFVRTLNDKIVFNLSTLTSTININNSLDYDYDGKDFETNFGEVIDSRQTLFNRLRQSVIVEGVEEIDPPTILIDLIVDPDSKVEGETFDNSDASDSAIYLVDLDADGTKTFYVSASAIGASVGYTWYASALDANITSTKVPTEQVNDKYFVKTADTEYKENKLYYVEVEEGVYDADTEVAVGSTISGDRYEKCSAITVAKTGNYCASIEASDDFKSKKIFSKVVRIPGPGEVTTENSEETASIILGEEGTAQLTVSASANPGDKLNYVWSVDNEVIPEIEGATYAIPVVAEADKAKFDKTYTVSITAERNKDVSATPVERNFRVTDAPHAVEVTAMLKNGKDRAYFCKSGGDYYAKLQAKIKVSDVISDSITYQWFKVNPDDTLELYQDINRNDTFTVDPAKIVDGEAIAQFEVCDAFKYVCVATNYVNGQSVASTPDLEDYLIVTH